MKCITLFLVLSLVVLMAEPGECFFFGHILHGLFDLGKQIHKLIHKGQDDAMAEQQKLEQRVFDRERAFA
ncbi:moronecidin-like [Cyclopterus lumpus]|uniref:moronecidin-like n=1 Tax=Cyclopterus lumpus TaxID=8103 RepID=UPI0014862B9F|nr:moronecidin-like [Cyclopterus lumpus]